MPSLLRRPVSAGARPCQGRSSLDRACAPAEYGSYREARTGKISQFEVSTLSGEPRLGAMRAAELAWWTSEFSGLRVIDCSLPAARLRAIKDSAELRDLAMAAMATSAALSVLEEKLEPGLTELDVKHLVEAELEGNSGQGLSFDPSIGSAQRSSLVWARPTLRRLSPGEPLLVDLGARRNGYCADMSRTYILDGPATESGSVARNASGLLEEIRAEVLASLRPGVQASQLARVARQAAARAGAPAGLGMPHAIGHGIGLEVHERPYLTMTSDDVISAHMAIAIEPGLYREGVGGARIEDMVVVTEDGHRPLISTEATSSRR